MNTVQTIILSSLLTLLSACATNHKTSLAANEEDYGIGGTGIVAENNGLGGTGIIGEITGFGSIFVNGIEVEQGTKTVISVNSQQVEQYNFHIGEVVEILTLDDKSHTGALQINVRHEVVGPVSFIDHDKSQLIILNQTIISEAIPSSVQVGDFIAVSGFRDRHGDIHASGITPSNPGEIILRGTVMQKNNNMQMHGIEIAAAKQFLSVEKNMALQGTIKQGKVTIIRILPDRTALLNKVPKWIIQGFPASYKSHWNDNIDLNRISGQEKPVVFKVFNTTNNTTSVKQLLQGNLPKGAAFNSRPQGSRSDISRPAQRGSRMRSGHGRKH